MPMADYERAVALIEESGVEADFCGSKPADLIRRAEAAVGIRFPPTYRRFLSEYGAGSFGGTEIYGVLDDDFVNARIPNAISYNLTLRREGYGEGLFVFYAVGDGGHFCLDTTRIAADGEMRVVGVYGGGREDVASDFGSAFLMLVQEELSFHDESPSSPQSS